MLHQIQSAPRKNKQRFMSIATVRRSGFSIIELLTVITIIGVLASILIPVMGSMRSSARTTQCVGNLRQIGAALALYAEEHNQNLPSAGTSLQNPPRYWPVELHHYTGAPFPISGGQPQEEIMSPVFRCPDWDFVRDTETFPQIGYAYATPHTGGAPDLSRTLLYSSLRAPSRTIVVTEHPEYFFDREATNGGPLLNDPSPKGALRHQTQANYLFADGHVESLTPDEAKRFFPGNP